ncbi:telomerase protein component 1-like [Colossoma macropomum]|uniref:telomerase protein component 1-like n=1 Tax=Colossoma macropomum TaxID=42526 RepID=UPI0018645109|nr:telomerase protein component 1-like [Colossoma macropomum]XP_036453088.1 telomerase protein component 1-like [Colossoma macropomum]
MKPLALLPTDLTPGEESRGRSSRTVPSLENRILAQASSILSQPLSSAPARPAPTSSISSPCPALQPSRLSSTQLKQDLFQFPSVSSSLRPPHSLSTALQSTTPPAGGLSAGGVSSSGTSVGGLFSEGLSAERLSDGGLAPGGRSGGLSAGEVSAVGPSAGEASAGGPSAGEVSAGPDEDQPSLVHRKRVWKQVSLCSTKDVQSRNEELTKDLDIHEGLVEMDQAPDVELRVTEEEEKWTVELSEEFRVPETDFSEEAEALKDKKYKLLNMVCCSLVSKSCSPGQKGWNKNKSVWNKIRNLAEMINSNDPEFLLKVAVYTRQELNKRLMASFLLALAAHLPGSKPHLRRYFCAAVQMPSDWLQVVRIYSTCFSSSLPTCLKKALVDKFKQFSEGQLAKYGKRSRRKRRATDFPPDQSKKWADLLRTDHSNLQKHLQRDQSEFSMQKLIKRLHIKEPAELVMSILGKKYPADAKVFERSGLSGVWQSDRAGQRMKLKQPDTWQTTLSREGNKAATWEKMIDRNSLPFVVMLKNLRNMITQGISAKHHDKILKRLTSESAVIQSKLLPFSFLAAYKVIMQLSRFVDSTPDSHKVILQGIVKRFRKRKAFKYVDWTSASRRRMRATLGVPLVYRLYKVKRRLLQRASQRKFSQELLERYLQALLKAVEISCRYNIPLIPGRTLICLSDNFYDNNWKQAGEFFLPPDPSEKAEKTLPEPSEDTEKTLPEPSEDAEKTLPEPSKDTEETLPEPSEDAEENDSTLAGQQAAILLAMLLRYGCEHSQVQFMSYSGFHEVEFKSDNFLENAWHGIKQMKTSWKEELKWTSYCNFFSKLTADKTKVDNIIVVNEYWLDSTLESEVYRYRKNTSSDALVVYLVLKPDGDDSDDNHDPHVVYLSEFSKQILKFVSERGSSRLLDHVENMDKLYEIPPPAGFRDKPERTTDVVPLPATPKLRWREVRVVISSSLRDVYAERDVLVHSVFPELRRRVAPHCLYLQEVELRSGLSEEEAAQAVELCLSEVGRSQLLLGILGERYGPVLPQPALTSQPQNSWLNSAPSGLSITEMEIRQFHSLYPDSAQRRMFFYFRSPHLVSSVPVAWRADFTAESRESEAKMDELKEWIRTNQFRVTENYPCEWGGKGVDGRPCVKGLEEFAKAVVEDLWAALQELFMEEVNEADVTSEITEQEVHQEAQRRHFHGRGKLVSMAIEKVKECQQKGGILLVEGRRAEGKTAFMAVVAHTLLTPDQSKNKAPLCDVVSYSTAASQSAGSVSQLLRWLVQRLRKMRGEEEELTSSTSYRALLSEFHLHLSDLREGPPLAVFIDGVDLVHDARGQVVSEWIPEHLPKGVCLVLSVTTDSALRVALSKKKRCVLFPLGELALTDRREIVQEELGVDGEELSDPAFSKQLQTLLMKKGAVSPLYLRLACEELRSLSSLQKMKDSLQALPHSLSELVQLTLLRLQSQFGAAGLDWTLAALTVSSTGLRERDLYPLLNLCSDLRSTQRPPTWQETLQLARNPKSRVPMAVFYQLTQNLRSLIRPSVPHAPDELLTLTNEDVRSAFQQLYVSTEEERTRAHLILAAHLWIRSDPHGNDTFIHCDVDALTHLLNHLMKCGQWGPVRFLLSSYYFLYANVRHGLLRPLLENFALFLKRDEAHRPFTEPSGDSGDLQQCADFLKRHAPLLTDWPALFVQQALNEVDGSPAQVWAQKMIQQGGVRALKWLNNTEHTLRQTGDLVSSLLWTPSCVAVSPGGGRVVVGTEKGTLHVFLSKTLQEVKSLVSSCDGISGCVFLEESVVCITLYSGQVEVWDIHSGCRTSRLKVHSSRITGCDVSSDRRLFATVSLDFSLKVWSSRGLQQMASLLQPSPPNCVTFDPKGGLLGVGCWDGVVRVWDWKRRENRATLSGHHSSVLCLSFSPSSSSLLCSGSLDGEVRLWSVPTVSCVWCCQAHRGSVAEISFLPDGETPLSAGRDGTVQLRGLVYCYSGAVRALARGRDGRFFSVSDDRTLRAWSVTPERRLKEKDFLSAACFLEKGELQACGFRSGKLELWHHNSLIYSKKVNDSCIRAVTGMPDKQLAVGCSDHSVSVWKFDLDSQPCTADLSKVLSYSVKSPVVRLLYNNILLGVYVDSCISVITSKMIDSIRFNQDWTNNTRPLGVAKNDEKSIWVLGEHKCELRLIFTLSVVSDKHWQTSFCDVQLGGEKDSDGEEDEEESKSKGSCEEPNKEVHEETFVKQSEEPHEERQDGTCEEQSEETSEEVCEEPHKETHEEQSDKACVEPCEETHEEQSEEHCEEYKPRKTLISAAAMHRGFIVCGDVRGYMWSYQPPSMTSSEKRQAHSDQVSVLRLTDRAIISASYDGTVKLWDRNTKKQVGLFVCGAPVEILEVNEDDPGQLMCGDALGQVYFLSWTG